MLSCKYTKKMVVSVFAIVLLICGVQSISYALREVTGVVTIDITRWSIEPHGSQQPDWFDIRIEVTIHAHGDISALDVHGLARFQGRANREDIPGATKHVRSGIAACQSKKFVLEGLWKGERPSGVSVNVITYGKPPWAIARTDKGKHGQIIMSEIMFESDNGSHTLPQWIELHNTTDTAINLIGWQLEWYRRDPKVLDVTTTFQSDFIVPAKQSRIIASTCARNSGEPRLNHENGSAYVLASHHTPQLDHFNRLIARGGFYLKLRDSHGTLIDHIGTLTGKTGDIAWELPECLINGQRSSMIRRFDDSIPRSGIERKGWIRAYDTKAQSIRSWYGRNTDIGTPAYRSDNAPLPVELSVFSARTVSEKVILNWTTESELNNAGFNILRSKTKAGPFIKVNPNLIQGAGTIGERSEYTWTDTTAKPNIVYYYRIEDVSYTGVQQQLTTVRLKGIVSVNSKLFTNWGDLKRRK